MKKLLYPFLSLLLLASACDNETESVFDESSAERAARATAELKDALVAPANGWRVRYQPDESTGSFWVLLDFNEDNTVTIRTDLGAEEGEYFDDELTYRVDNSLGLELIFESYSFFSYLFERNQATFPAEYEFVYANETPDGELVFQSKTDFGNPTILVLEEAGPNDLALLGRTVATNLGIISDDIQGLVYASPSYQLTYTNRDLAFFLNLDEFSRTLRITSASRKTTSSGTQNVNFETGYYLRGDSIVFHTALAGTYQGVSVSLKGIRFSALSDGQLALCNGIPIHRYQGVTSQNDAVVLEPNLNSPRGATFATTGDFYVAPTELIFNNGESAAAAIAADITGALAMQLYYNNDGFYALGFIIENPGAQPTFALRQFTPQLTGNRIVFNFAPTIDVYGNPDTAANLDNVNTYLQNLTSGGQTYAFEVQEGVYEFFNPCTRWSAVFISY